VVQLDEKIQRIFGNLDVKLLLGNIIYWLKKRIAKYAENNKKSLTLVYGIVADFNYASNIRQCSY